MKPNWKEIKEQYVKLDEKIAKLEEETFEQIGYDSAELGQKIETFEKELRERIQELEKCIRKNKGDSFNNMRLTLIAQIKEILGESA